MNNKSLLNIDFLAHLESLEKYNQVMEDFLINEYFEHRKIWEKDKTLTLKSLDEKLPLMNNLALTLNFYPNSFRNSFLVQIFSFFEKKLKEICLEHYKITETVFSINDLKGNSDIEKAKKYLTKTCSIKFSELNPEWNFMNDIRKIRNIIVHSQGEINQLHNDWKTIWNFINNNKSLIGFSCFSEYLDKKLFDKESIKEDFLEIEIQNENLNYKIINTVKYLLVEITSKVNKKIIC